MNELLNLGPEVTSDTERIDWLSKFPNVERVWWNGARTGFSIVDEYGVQKSFPTIREAIDAEIAKEQKAKGKP